MSSSVWCVFVCKFFDVKRREKSSDLQSVWNIKLLLYKRPFKFMFFFCSLLRQQKHPLNCIREFVLSTNIYVVLCGQNFALWQQWSPFLSFSQSDMRNCLQEHVTMALTFFFHHSFICKINFDDAAVFFLICEFIRRLITI